MDALGEFRKELNEAIYNCILKYQGTVFESSVKVFGIPVFSEYTIEVDENIKLTLHGGLLANVFGNVYASTRMTWGWIRTEVKLSRSQRLKAVRHILNYDEKVTVPKKPWGHQLSHMEKMLCNRFNIPFE